MGSDDYGRFHESTGQRQTQRSGRIRTRDSSRCIAVHSAPPSVRPAKTQRQPERQARCVGGVAGENTDCVPSEENAQDTAERFGMSTRDGSSYHWGHRSQLSSQDVGRGWSVVSV